MAKGFGKDYRIWVESAVAGTYNMVKGQGDLKETNNVSYVDLSDKDSFPWGAQAPGTRQKTLSLSMKIDLPDNNGYGRLETFSQSGAAVNVQIRKGGATGASGDVTFQGSCFTVITDRTYPTAGVVECTITFTLAAAPVTDAMAI